MVLDGLSMPQEAFVKDTYFLMLVPVMHTEGLRVGVRGLPELGG